jgi:hypothetical protein
MKSLEIDTILHATSVSVDSGWVCVRLSDDREIRFPAAKNRRLAKASSSQLKNVELICSGTGLHWPELDEDLSVQGILEGRFGQVDEPTLAMHR